MNSQSRPDATHFPVLNLPPLPETIRYYDDFSDSYNQVADPSHSDHWKLSFDGRNASLNFSDLDMQIRKVIKCWCAFLLGELCPVTACKYLESLKTVPMDQIILLMTSSPYNVRTLWKELHACSLQYGAFAPLSNLLGFLCRFSIGAWRPNWQDLISQLPYPKVDKYARVRVGDVFLTVDEETAIVRHIDKVGNRVKAVPSSIPDQQLEETAMLVCSYQFGLRTKQIAMLEVRNVRIWSDGLSDQDAVHLTFTMIKQRSAKRVFPMVRRVKREWSSVFIELSRRAHHDGMSGADHVFDRNPRECSKAIADILKVILRHRRTAAELRHTAAQRLVDAGASEEELAAFMGHSDLNTGLPYFQSSPAQAERVNRALGISATYQRVAKIAHDLIITPQELIELKGDQQIGGVPHGIPITGIGGCSKGQPSCPYNPITSCYGCSRFMPIADVAVHRKVLGDFRDVVKVFYASSRGERGSPAFQLERTISNVKAVIDELEAEIHELKS